jgi:hypothetical protein
MLKDFTFIIKFKTVVKFQKEIKFLLINQFLLNAKFALEFSGIFASWIEFLLDFSPLSRFLVLQVKDNFARASFLFIRAIITA